MAYRRVLALLWVLGIHSQLLAAKAVQPTPRAEDGALVLWDETRIKATDTLRSPTVATTGCGDLVLVNGKREGRLRVKANGVTGWVGDRQVVRLDAPGAASRLFVAAREREEPTDRFGQSNRLQAAALYWRFQEFFPGSQYEALVLYRYGQLAERLAVEATRRAEQQLGAEAKRGDDGRLRWQGLAEYRKWGLQFSVEHFTGAYWYDGEGYERILKEHPRSEWADNAAYSLLKLKRVGEWEGYPSGPLAELEKGRQFLRKYPRSELKPRVLLETGYLHRVLFEIYSAKGQFADPKAADEHRRAARQIYESIRRQFPASEFAARAEVNLADLSEGRRVYIVSR